MKRAMRKKSRALVITPKGHRILALADRGLYVYATGGPPVKRRRK